jgi:anti-sigma factor RsiW
MECQDLHRHELAEKYLNGSLDPAMQDEFEVHILDCANCLRYVEALQVLRQELAQTAGRIRAFARPIKL